VVLAVLLTLPVSIGVSRLFPAAHDAVATVASSVEQADAAAPPSTELVQQRAAARAVLSPLRDLTGRHPLRTTSVFVVVLTILLVAATRRDRWRAGCPLSPQLSLLASTSCRRGPPVVA
jgi:hypothetical protein